MTVPALAADGQIPLGRWPAAMDEVEAAFVTGLHPKRQAIWDDWLTLLSAMRAAVTHLPAVWLGGSLLSDRPEPGDIDAVFLLEWRDLVVSRLDPPAHRFLGVVASNQVEPQFGLSVDSFILELQLFSGPEPSVMDWEALKWRGYWDQFWSRRRDPDRAVDATPRRGYLEVIVDGYGRS